MAPQAKANPDDTRTRIIEVAERLFRQYGYAKTTVVDIASDLKMSPANVYRFFSSKDAIVEAICRHWLAELEQKLWAIARSRTKAATRLERMVLEILAFHKEKLLREQKVSDVFIAAVQGNWGAIEAHKEITHKAAELIVRDGIDAGEFDSVDPRETARLLISSFIAFIHPVVISEYLSTTLDVEAEARATVRFVLRALTPRS